MASLILLSDGFNGKGINLNKWKLPSPGDSSFFGRTQLRLDEYPKIINGYARLRLDTFNPKNTSLSPTEVPSVLGSEIISQRKFNLATGLSMKAKVRVLDANNNPILPGLVTSFFGFALDENGDPGKIGATHDELDFEFLTNDILAAQDNSSSQEVLTNVFDDASFQEAGSGEFIPVPGLDLTIFNTFEIIWKPDQVQWKVNGNLIRTESDIVPDESMDIRLNMWAPATEFGEAFNSTLQPAFSVSDNQSAFYDVDFVQVTRLSLDGTNARDTLRGGRDDDYLRGLGGNDLIVGNGAGDLLSGGSGEDTLRGGGGDDRLLGGVDNDVIQGDSGFDQLVGGGDDDLLVGGSGGDLLNGSDNGGLGVGERDTLAGGGGPDQFVLGTKTRSFYLDQGSGSQSFATITTLQSIDTVRLEGARSNYRLVNGNAGIWIFRIEPGLDDHIALIKNDATLSLNDSQFVFLG